MPEKKNTIGRFEIIEKIGEGPIGAVYKALDPVIRRTVAIKVIKLYALEETTTFAEVFEKIYRVVRTSTSLNHPNICIIYDLSEEKKIPYITMEYVDGHDLESLLKQKHQFKRQEFLNILQQTCDALDFAHKKNVIHQDFKSTNILVTSDLHVKITDFGIAGLDEIAAAQTKKLLSIPHYISPEQALGERVSPASDLFSLGVVIFHMLSGELPFPGITAANTIMMIARDAPTIPSNQDRFPVAREDWNSFFSIALAKSPNQRFRSAREMLEALNSILPVSDQTYYPFGFEGAMNDSTGKFEKTYIAEEDAEAASPTLMIDASQIMEESAPEIDPKLVKLEQEAVLYLDANTAEFKSEEPVIEPDEGVQAPESWSIPEAEQQTLLQTGIQEEQPTERSQEPVKIEEEVAQKTELIEMPFGASVDLSVEQREFSESTPEEKAAPIPTDFVPASGTFLEMENLDSDDIATIPPTPISEIAMQASDTAPIVGAAAEPVQEKIEEPITAPTQLFQPPPPEPVAPEPSKGNGRDPEPFEEVPPTVMSTFQPPEITEEPPAPATVLIPRPVPVPEPEPEPKPVEPPPEILKPTKITSEVAAAAPEIKKPAPEPPRPKPVPPPPRSVPAEPVHPLTKPVEAPPVAAAKPPSMQRYFYGAIAVFIFIAIVGGAILFLRKPQPPPPTPQPPKQIAQPKQVIPKPVETPVAPADVQGSIMITSEPTGATVFLAGEEKGVTPYELPQLPLGKHMVKLQLKGYQDLEQEVELSAENPNANLPVTLQKVAAVNGTLIVESEPTGAFIVVANRVLGVTPKSFTRKPGNYSITLKKDGYQDYTGSVTVTKDKRATFKGALAVIPKPVPVVEAPKPKPPEVTRGQLVTLGPDVVPPKPIKKIYAKYPDAAKARKLEGTVRLNVLVDETGRVLDIKVAKSSGHPMLDDAVVNAYRQWQFAPATKQNVPVKVWVTVAMSFQSGR